MAIRVKNTDKLKFSVDENGDYKITVKGVILSYEHVHRPWCKDPEKETPKYSGKFMLNAETHEKEIEIIENFLADLKKSYWPNGIKMKPADLFFRDGDQEGKEEMEGHWIISASEKATHKPAVLDRDKTPVTEADDKIYSGAVVNVMIKPWKQDNKWGKKINANLLAVQFVKHGKKFGGGGGATQKDIDDNFDEMEAEEEDDGFED